MEFIDFEKLLVILQQASSQNSEVVSVATKALQENETKKGFHVALLKVALANQQNIDINIRWLAVLCLKNGIERHWRSHGLSPLSDTEKTSIRNDILSYFSENVEQVALQFAVIVSKIARFDYPRSWPDLPKILITSIANLKSSSQLLQDLTILLTFRYVIKELSSKQLPNDRKAFKDLSNDVFPIFFAVWKDHNSAFVDGMQQCKTGSVTQKHITFSIQKLTNIFKSFRSMILTLNEENFTKLLEAIIASMQFMLNCIDMITKDQTVLHSLFHKLLIVHSKILLDLVEFENPFIRKFSDGLVSLHKQCLFVYSDNKKLFSERFVVNCLNFLKVMFSKNSVSSDLLTIDDLQSLLRCLIFSFLPLTEVDLESWECDAEEFCSEEIGETWRYNIRPSAEVFFLTLLHLNSEQLIPLLLSTLHTVNESTEEVTETTDLKEFLVNDVVFTAIGLACHELFDQLDFESWFVTILLPYVQKSVAHPGGKIIHRRILWLIDQWTGAKPITGILATVYDFVISSLDRRFDMAVRLTASAALRQVLDDFEFDSSIFAPYQLKCTDSLYALLEDTKSSDAKMRSLHVMSFIVERHGPEIVSSIEKLSSLLPSIWKMSESHNMLRCAVVATLVNVVNSLRGNHTSMQAFLTNVIHVCTDISSPAHIYLLGDGLALWIAFLHNTNQITENLLQLFNNIYGLLELSSESLKECLEVVECYVLLGGESFLGGRHGSDLALAISSLITDVRDECLIIVARLIETMIKVASGETPFVFQKYLRDTIHHVLQFDGTVLATARLLVVSRLAFLNVSAFWNLFSQENGERTNEAILAFLKVVSDRIDNVVDVAQRKLVALAGLAVLNSFSDLDTVQRAISLVFPVLIQVLYDVCDENNLDTYVTDAGRFQLKAEEWDTFHSLRTRALIRSDLSHQLALPDVLKEALSKLSSAFGGDEPLRQSLFRLIGQDCLQELQEFLR